jgi:hypothetical protein
MSNDAYQAYLARFDQALGRLAVGAYAKWQGQLIRKLAPDEFSRKDAEFTKLRDHYLASLERGDTLNDVITKLLRERSRELLINEESIMAGAGVLPP